MDKALVYGTRDSGFDPQHGRSGGSLVVSPTTFTSQTEHPAESNEFQKLLTQFYDTYAIEGLIV